MRSKVLALPRTQKRIISIVVDILAIWLSVLLAYEIRFAGIPREAFMPGFWLMIALGPVTSIPFYIRLGLYRAILRYMGSFVSMTIFRACFLGFITLSACIVLSDFNVPRSVPVLYWFFSLILVTSSRYAICHWLRGIPFSDLLPSVSLNYEIPVVIYGAGVSGTELYMALKRSREYNVVAFVDDNVSLAGNHIYGCPVWYGDNDNIGELMTTHKPAVFILAMPSARRSARKRVLAKLESLDVQVRSVPSMADLASGRLNVQQTRVVDIGDLLGRDAVPPDYGLLTRNIIGKVVMVTGAGGSIGSEIARQVIALKPKALVLMDHSEFNLYSIDKELRRQDEVEEDFAEIELITVLGSVNDPDRLVETMSIYEVETIYHAAAYKHVPMVEHNLSQGLRNNVLGTLYTAQAAIVCGVEKFVLISTDKAVRPTNVMGASKRLAEMVLQSLNEESIPKLYRPDLFSSSKIHALSGKNKTCFTIVRFGNVLGSSGSVIPVFHEQIAAGGPITVTHPDINRYFMTIPEAAQLVMQAGAMGKGGDVFVLDMGQPVKIVDLARRMISLSGLTVRDAENPEGDIEIAFSGLRPGEKLYEELLIGDSVTNTEHPKICSAREQFLAWEKLQLVLDDIMMSLQDHDYYVTRELLLKYVDGYTPSSRIVDWLFRHQSQKKKAI